MLMAFVREKTEKKPSQAAMHEHFKLFPQAFPEMEEATVALGRFLKKAASEELLAPRLRREGVRKLKPFFHICKSDEGLWLFLMKQGHHLDIPKNIVLLLQELYPEDLSAVSLRMSGLFSARGFASAAKDCVSLFYTLQNHA